MKPTPSLLILAFGVLLADPAMAQSRAKDASGRDTPAWPGRDRQAREAPESTTVEADTRRTIRATVRATRPRQDDHLDRTRALRDSRSRIIVVAPGEVYRGGSHRFDIAPGVGRVWNRAPGMTCARLDDELESAHDEWHYRHDGDRHESWYAIEHARLERRIAEERAYSACDRTRERRYERDCSDRGRHPRTSSTLEIAILVLDILLRD